MDKHIGVKILEHAEPMTLLEYNEFRGWKQPEGKTNAEGYLVVYSDSNANTEKYAGYVSWSPKNVFEEAYRRINNLTFGLATEAMLKAKKVTREGWNGKDMWIEVQMPYNNSKMTRPFIYHCSRKGSTNHYGDDVKEIERVPWLPSNTDIFAEDWRIVE